MSIAEKLKTIAENQAKVCNAGFAAGYDTGFRAGEDEGFSDGYDDGYAEGYGKGYGIGRAAGILDGRQAEYDALWDKLQPLKAGATQYAASFGQAWTADIFKPKYDMTVRASIFMFAYNQIGGDLVEYFERLGKKLDFSPCFNANNAFAYSKFTRVGGIYCSTPNFQNTFEGCSELETIDEWGNYNENGNISGNLMNTFYGCSKLKNLTVKGVIAASIRLSDCPLLSKASIESVITHLTDENIWATATFSATAVNNAFGSTESAEWKALIATKPTWTFSLV